MRAKFLLIMMLPLNFAAMAGDVDLLKPEYSRKSLELRRLMEEIAQRGLQYEITHASAKREAFFFGTMDGLNTFTTSKCRRKFGQFSMTLTMHLSGGKCQGI